MQPERKLIIEGDKVEEFYWNGNYLVYLNNKAQKGSFEYVCRKVQQAADAATLTEDKE